MSRSYLAGTIIALAWACSPAPTQPVTVASVSVAIQAPSLPAEATTQASAVARDADGRTISGKPALWLSNSPQVATIASDGTVTAVSPGQSQIQATIDGITGTAFVTVTPAPVASVGVTISKSTLEVTETGVATATPRSAGGSALTGRTVFWSSSANAVATVSQSGAVVGVTPGTVTITASVEGTANGVVVTVVPATVATVQVSPAAIPLMRTSQTVQLTAITRDARGNVLSGRLVTFTTTNEFRVTAGGTGLLMATGPSTTPISIIVSSEGRSTQAVIAEIRGWSFTNTLDPLGGFPTLRMELRAEPDSPGGQAAALSITCFGGSSVLSSIAVNTGGPITRDGSIRYRIDLQPAVSQTWLEAGSFRLLVNPFFHPTIAALAQALGSAGEFLFEYGEFLGPDRIAKFIPTGASMWLPQILNACAASPVSPR